MTNVQPTTPTALAAELGPLLDGEVLVSGDTRYDEARRVWNGCIDRRPALIARCRSTADVVTAVNLARERGLLLAVRGGGHGVAGFGTCDDGLVLDLSPMRLVTVDRDRRLTRVQAGCTWGDYDAATAASGLASTGGLVSTTGVAGLTLGGGIGWLMRRYGLACDNLVSAEVVTAAGEMVRTGRDQNPELLWGLRGGGGNFGVVTEFEFTVHPVSTVTAGMAFFPEDRAVEVARFYRDYVLDLPDELTTMLVLVTAPSEPFIPVELQGRLAVAVVGCHCGEQADAEAGLAPIRALSPAADLFDVMPYPELQSIFDADLPPGKRYYFKGGFTADCSDAMIEVMLGYMRDRPALLNEIDLHHMGGAVSRVGDADGAFADRSSPFCYNVIGIWDDPDQDEANRAWSRDCAAALERFGGGRMFVNFASDPGATEALRTGYGDTRYARLLELKRRWDPVNLFRLNQNIRP